MRPNRWKLEGLDSEIFRGMSFISRIRMDIIYIMMFCMMW